MCMCVLVVAVASTEEEILADWKWLRENLLMTLSKCTCKMYVAQHSTAHQLCFAV